ncbi:DUF4913 domain-containing protein [Cellulomonas fulva]|uniref:DUF4913 domain-containing protein n=1 Tax=Cellulomonas fulva TaxID=2835530 RepID=UPI001F3E847F|nr:DUF4913 domain-containing protein [Cellulomonas fulva]
MTPQGRRRRRRRGPGDHYRRPGGVERHCRRRQRTPAGRESGGAGHGDRERRGVRHRAPSRALRAPWARRRPTGGRRGGGNAEAISRLEAVWRAWEALLQEPSFGMVTWWRDHADSTWTSCSRPTDPSALKTRLAFTGSLRLRVDGIVMPIQNNQRSWTTAGTAVKSFLSLAKAVS